MHRIQREIVKLSKKNDLNKLSLSEIATLIGVNSPQAVKYHKNKLRYLGYNFNDDTNITPSESVFELISIPIVGAANCGPATIFADSRIEGHVRLSPRLLNTRRRNDLYAVRAEGNSMDKAKVNGEAIRDGDYVIVDSQSFQPQSGDYIVAVVGGMANIKKYHFDPINNQVALISESTGDSTPIFLHEDDQYDAVISGKVIQVVRMPSK